MNVMLSHKRPLKKVKMDDGTEQMVDFGFVGDVDQCDGRMLATLIGEGVVPVMAPLTHDKQGNLLVGTDNGLYIVGSNRTVDHILHDARVGESLAGDAVWSLFRDRDDNIWIGTNSGISMVADNDLLVAYPLHSLTGSGMGNQLFCICSDPQGRYWMGGSNGLICIENLG